MKAEHTRKVLKYIQGVGLEGWARFVEELAAAVVADLEAGNEPINNLERLNRRWGEGKIESSPQYETKKECLCNSITCAVYHEPGFKCDYKKSHCPVHKTTPPL